MLLLIVLKIHFLIYRSSLGKILLEDRCCFRYTLSATSNKDLQNRNLFPSSPLLPSMKIPCPCLIKVLNASLGILIVRCFIASSIEFLLLSSIFVATQNYKKRSKILKYFNLLKNFCSIIFIISQSTKVYHFPRQLLLASQTFLIKFHLSKYLFFYLLQKLFHLSKESHELSLESLPRFDVSHK